MAIPKSVIDAEGHWEGASKLHVPGLVPDQQVFESESVLKVLVDRNATHGVIGYVWTFEGDRHDGTILVAGDARFRSVELAWSDSWHQSNSVMHLKGVMEEDGSFKAQGAYGAGDAVWGWTIALALVGQTLTLKMENVLPDGTAEWAVEATYRRV